MKGWVTRCPECRVKSLERGTRFCSTPGCSGMMLPRAEDKRARVEELREQVAHLEADLRQAQSEARKSRLTILWQKPGEPAEVILDMSAFDFVLRNHSSYADAGVAGPIATGGEIAISWRR